MSTTRLGGAQQIYWTAADLMATQFPPPRWAVPGLVSEGVNLLVSQPKVGKSWLALNLSVAVASGGKAMGKISVERGDVLYLGAGGQRPPPAAPARHGLAGRPTPRRAELRHRDRDHGPRWR